MHREPPVRGQGLGDQPVELGRIQLRTGGDARVREVGDHHVVPAVVGPEPGERVRPDDGEAGVAEGVVVQLGEGGVGTGQSGDGGVQLDDGDRTDVPVAQHLTGGEPVAAAQDEHAGAGPVHRGVHQRLVVAVLVAGADPQPAVQIEAEGVPVGAGHHDLLHPGLHGDPHLVPVHRPPRRPLEIVDQRRGGGQHRDHRDVDQDEEPAGAGAEVAPEHPQHERPARRRVDRAGEQGAGQLPQHRQQQKGEREPADQRAHVVGGEEIGDGPARVLPVDALDQRHQQRDLRADQHPDRQREPDQGVLRIAEPGERGVEDQRRGAADQGEGRLDHPETDGGTAAQTFREKGTDAHREHHHGEHDGRLGDRIADEIRGERDQFELVDETAGGADEDRGQHEEPAGPRPYGKPRRAPSQRHLLVDHVANATSRHRRTLSPTRV
ncbi:hypothetical protein P376_2490 [Streptomyces sp. HCCB10043]|nr:hypothetical protein P376_2490 [Streptomyces sp. HCCB10043]